MKWSITDSIYLFKSYDGSVFVANPEQKKLWGAVKKISESTSEPELLKNENLKVRFVKGKIELEVSGTWRELRNIDILPPQLGQFSGATLISGVSEETSFAFKADIPERAALVFKGTDFYKSCEEEFNKRTIFSLYKKTRSLIPGHKYQSENMTYYYLGKVNCHKTEYNANSYLSSPYTVHAFVTDPGTGSAEDIFRTYSVEYVNVLPSVFIDKTIFIPSRISSMVDLGEFITNPGTVEGTWERRFGEAEMEPYTFWSGKHHYKDSQRLFSILDLSTADNPQVSDATKDQVKRILQSEIRYLLFGCYDVRIFVREKCVVSSDTEDQQVEALKLNLGCKFRDGLSRYFWDTMRTLMGIDADDLIRNELRDFRATTFTSSKDSTFSDLLENFEFYRYRQSDKFDLTINFKYVGVKNQNFTTFFGTGAYKNAIKDIFEKAIETGGGNVASYQVDNIGTITKPLLQHTIRITLPDLMEHFGVMDPNDFPEDIKQGILDNKNYSITLITDDNLTING